MHILVTGAAGKIGRATRKELAAAGHRLRLADVQPIEQPEGESLVLDIADGKAVQRAMEGIEAVVHLAYGKGWYDDPHLSIQSSFDVNAKGTYNLLFAATQAKAARFVYSSTLSIFGHTISLARKHVNELTPPAPEDVYGLTKYLGEEACSFFSRCHGLNVVTLRLCNVLNEAEWQEARREKTQTEWEVGWRSMSTHVEDVARAIRLAVELPNVRHEVIHIAADNKGRLTDIQKATDLLGFWPKHRLDD